MKISEYELATLAARIDPDLALTKPELAIAYAAKLVRTAEQYILGEETLKATSEGPEFEELLPEDQARINQ